MAKSAKRAAKRGVKIKEMKPRKDPKGGLPAVQKRPDKI
jgi:hypothetical protein